MNDRAQPALLNELLNRQYRSLPHYVAECWPWTHRGNAEARAALERIIQKQDEHCAAIADLITRRGGLPMVEGYPSQFVDRNFLALDYVLEELVAYQNEAVQRLEQMRQQCAGDAEAADLVQRILSDEREHSAALQRVASNLNSGAAQQPAASAAE
ncbi:MAG: ferritin-like domain-containing protein [Pirellulales bacterium]